MSIHFKLTFKAINEQFSKVLEFKKKKRKEKKKLLKCSNSAILSL